MIEQNTQAIQKYAVEKLPKKVGETLYFDDIGLAVLTGYKVDYICGNWKITKTVDEY